MRGYFRSEFGRMGLIAFLSLLRLHSEALPMVRAYQNYPTRPPRKPRNRRWVGPNSPAITLSDESGATTSAPPRPLYVRDIFSRTVAYFTDPFSLSAFFWKGPFLRHRRGNRSSPRCPNPTLAAFLKWDSRRLGFQKARNIPIIVPTGGRMRFRAPPPVSPQ